MSEDEQRGAAWRAQFLEALGLSTEHEDITIEEAFRKVCEAAITVYDGTKDQHVADRARQALRRLDEASSAG